MQASSDSQTQDNVIINQSFNQTANSIHHQNHLEQNAEMHAFQPLLQQFLQQELEIKQFTFKFDDLEENTIFKEYEIIFLQPIPKVYFLPYQILFLNKRNQYQPSKYSQNIKMDEIRTKVQTLNNLEKKQYTISYDNQLQTLALKLHNKSQLVYYTLRILKIDKKYQKQPELLDHMHLIDKLFLYYEKYYEKLYFKETAVYILYWAYQKDLFNYELTEHTLKIIIICIFINFGYGVTNIIEEYSKNGDKIKENKVMNSFTRINNRGETEIDDTLINKYKNYTIHQKRGFYIVSKKRFLQIKDIVSINFPLVPLSVGEDKKQTDKIDKNIDAILKSGKENMSICKNISKIFKFLHNKFQKRIKMIIDFQIALAYRQQYSQNFEIEIFHPVLGTSISKLAKSSIRKIHAQIKAIHDQFSRYADINDIMKDMLSKKGQ